MIIIMRKKSEGRSSKGLGASGLGARARNG